MRVAMRKQNDSLARFRAASLKSALNCSDSKDMARQEHKNETDINLILHRFGVDPQMMRPAQYGHEIDYTIDLQQALGHISASKNAYNRLAPEIKSRFKNWQAMLQAMESGEMEQTLEEAGKKYKNDNQRPIPETPIPEPKAQETVPKTGQVPKSDP